jgi:hypothetical protein
MDLYAPRTRQTDAIFLPPVATPRVSAPPVPSPLVRTPVRDPSPTYVDIAPPPPATIPQQIAPPNTTTSTLTFVLQHWFIILCVTSIILIMCGLAGVYAYHQYLLFTNKHRHVVAAFIDHGIGRVDDADTTDGDVCTSSSSSGSLFSSLFSSSPSSSLTSDHKTGDSYTRFAVV